MIDWIKPSGLEIQTNDRPETIAYCESLGWKQKGVEIKTDLPQKRKRRTKAEMEADQLDKQNQ